MRFCWVFSLLAVSYLAKASILTVEDVSGYRDSDGIINIAEENYRNLGYGLREFYSVLFITSDKPNGKGEMCELCELFEPNLRVVSRNIIQKLPKDQSDRIAFFKLDLADNPSFLKEFQVNKIPFCLVYPPQLEKTIDGQDFAWKHSPFYQYVIKKDFMRQPVHFGNFIAKILNVFLTIDQDFEYDKFIQGFVIAMCFFVLFKKKILPLIQDRTRFFFICLSISIILISISGYNFFKIQRAPFIARNDDGDIMWFSGGTQYQFGLEVVFVSLLYLALGTFTVCLILVPKRKSGSNVRKYLAEIIIATCLVVLYAYLLSVFKIKSPSYPYVLF